MPTVRAQFVDKNSFGSRAIGWFSAGHLSHVDIVLDDDMLTELGVPVPWPPKEDGQPLLGARFDKAGGKPSGVWIRPPEYEPWRHRLLVEFDVTGAEKDAGTAFLKEQLGKEYDWRAILGFAFARDWRLDGAWFCSELCARWMEVMGVVHKLYLPTNKITPVACATLASGVGRVLQQELRRSWLLSRVQPRL